MHKLWQYLRYLRRAKTKHGVHSPFVFEFVTQVLPYQASEAGTQIEHLRKACLRSPEKVVIEDLGAGYAGLSKPILHKTIAQVARSSARRRKEGELLMRICSHYGPAQVLELGTNLGFSGLYMLAGLATDAQMITIEGAKELSKYAQTQFAAFGHAPKVINAEFGSALQNQIDWDQFKPGLVLLDGNHRRQATLDYFAFLLPHIAEKAIIILDDIYWSEEMTQAWHEIKGHERVKVSLDLFGLGICFLDRPQATEHFTLWWP